MSATESERRFRAEFDVSRETIARLETYEALVQKWNPAINLVARSTLDDIWNRHFRDSARVFEIAQVSAGRWLDLGSGGGFPALVVAILAREKAPGLKVTCVESDIRKCEFLRAVARSVNVSVGVLSRRVQEVPAQNADVISARALAPLTRLLDLSAPHVPPAGTLLFHKGRNWQQEVDEALESWTFTVEKHDNPTHPDSVILKIGDIARA